MFAKLTFRSLFLAVLLAMATATPVTPNMVLHELRQTVPAGFSTVGPAAAEATLTLRIALAQNDMAGLENALYDVSTPSSPLYGQHLSKEQVEAYVKPNQNTVSAVNAWLSSNGLTASKSSPAGDWLTVSVPVSKANQLFSADFTVFKHSDTGKETIRTMSYSIPASLKGHIDLVHPTTTFPDPNARLPVISSPSKLQSRSNLARGVVPDSCAFTITPVCLQALYNIPATPATQKSNALGVVGFLDEYAQQADLTKFLTHFRTDMSNLTSFSLQTLDGGINPQAKNMTGLEADLDIQYTVGVATGVPITYISVGDNYQDGDLGGFLDVVDFLLAESNPPQVLSTSYGMSEPLMSQALANNLCNAYMQLSARGTSVIYASGDGGVAGPQDSDCTSFVPTFPAGCPYVTSVGATNGIAPEYGVTFSSGGFSNYWAAPKFQKSIVSKYVKSIGKTYKGLFNTTGRGFPDVAAQGQSIELVTANSYNSVAGTSASAPIFASIVALLNDELIAAGKKPLGWLNPFLYSAKGAASFNDITTGNNPGCNTNGFNATAGWDPVTGLGSPDFAKLKAALGL
ncbi:family S53 protease-like protein [Rickenella mellea]|uniref:tripeptidyl-peptidase II n=1 Tax=Rickenella mellea TaxID=50990 RepID=A0A4Y7QAW9_9AGAM|nr:family S53 protease-like protein [Rickenella mellea]